MVRTKLSKIKKKKKKKEERELRNAIVREQKKLKSHRRITDSSEIVPSPVISLESRGKKKCRISHNEQSAQLRSQFWTTMYVVKTLGTLNLEAVTSDWAAFVNWQQKVVCSITMQSLRMPQAPQIKCWHGRKCGPVITNEAFNEFNATIFANTIRQDTQETSNKVPPTTYPLGKKEKNLAKQMCLAVELSRLPPKIWEKKKKKKSVSRIGQFLFSEQQQPTTAIAATAHRTSPDAAITTRNFGSTSVRCRTPRERPTTGFKLAHRRYKKRRGRGGGTTTNLN